MTNTPTFKQRIISVFLTVLLIGYVGNTSFFIHEHEVGDIKIVHSHPYTSSSHSHTVNSFATISLLSHIVALMDVAVSESDRKEQLIDILLQEQKCFCNIVTIGVLSLRAPPIL